MWRTRITIYLVYFDPTPYSTATNDLLHYRVVRTGNIYTIGGVLRGEGSCVAFGERCKSGSCLLIKYVLFGDRYRNGEDGGYG